MDDVQQMIVNEVKRLERVIEKRSKALDEIVQNSKMRSSPRKYVLEYVFPVESPTTRVLNIPITRSFVVDKDCSRFFCQEIVCSIAAVGTIVGSATSNKITMPASFQNVDFTWRIRDTATDREWQSQPLPRYFLASGVTAPLSLSWPAAIRPGTETEVTIVPTAADATLVNAFANVTSYTVQIAFAGFEVL